MRTVLIPPRRLQSGLSLVEVSLALVICGILVIVLWQFVVVQADHESSQQSDASLDRASAALDAYAFVHARLPCPAQSTDGLESCGGSGDGYLPYLTLGLPSPDAGKLRYGVASPGPTLTGGGAFGFHALMNVTPATATVDPQAVLVPVKSLSSRSDGMLDFCAALAAPGTEKTLAYKLSADVHAGGGHALSFGKSGRSVSRLQLLGILHCPALMATAGRAHFNTQLAAASMSKAIQDYRTQFEVAFGLAQFDLSQGIWFMVNGLYSAAKKWAAVPQSAAAAAAAAASPELAPKEDSLATTILARTSSGVYALAMISNVARFYTNRTHAIEDRKTNDQLVDNAVRLEQEITRNAVLDSASAFFLHEQQLPPVGPVMGGSQSAYAVSGPAAAMVNLVDGFARDLGLPVDAGLATQDEEPQTDPDARQLAEALSTCGSEAACDAVTAGYAERIRQRVDQLQQAATLPVTPVPAAPASSGVSTADKEIAALYDNVRNCSGEAACAAAGDALSALVRQKAGELAGVPAGASGGNAAADAFTQKIRLCAQDMDCYSAAIRQQADEAERGRR